MKVYLAEHYGFCYGVKRAVELAQASADGSSVKTLGPIIHNPQVVGRLADQGVSVANDLSEINDGKIIIRSHGVGPRTYDEAKAKNLNIIDATCPHVKKAQLSAYTLLNREYQVVVVGEKNHPEVKSIVEWSNNTAIVIQTKQEAESMPFYPQLGVVVQTTFAGGDFEDIVRVLKTKCDEIKIERTICNATEARQQAAVKLAKIVDVMVVVGGKNSANTSRLAELCRQVSSKVYHIETQEELKEEWFYEAKAAGVTAGASTPDWIIEEVVKTMQEFNNNQDIQHLESGSIVKGTIVDVRADEVFVDIGYKSEGIISKAELAYPTPDNISDIVKVGDIIDVFVIDADSEEGSIRLSKVMADKALAWDKLHQAFESKKAIEVKVTEAVKGGLAVGVFGLRGFIPASHVGLRFVQDISQYVGETFNVLPIEIDKDKNKVVLSRKAILEEERNKLETEVLANLTVNQELKGTVTRLADFGAFVDIGGVEGLIHISDLSWHRVKSPSEVVNVGDEVRVIVLKVDAQAKKLSLGLKQTVRDPWLDAIEEVTEGTVIKGIVSKIAKFGAFIKIKPDIEGLVHVSEISDRRVTNVSDVLEIGQEVKVKVLSVDKANKRIALSIAKAQEDAERAEYRAYLNTQDKPVGVTLGEKFGHLFKRED